MRRLLSVAPAAALLLLLSVAPSVAAGGEKTVSGQLKPAVSYDDPTIVLASRLEANLRASDPTSFAGLVDTENGAILVYSTGNDAMLQQIASRSVASVRLMQPARNLPSVQVIAGHQNSLASLERVRDAITAHEAELAARGIRLAQWGPDISNNKTLVEVEGLTPQIKSSIEREFGPGQVEVVASSGWQPTSRQMDSPPWYGGDTLQNTPGYSFVCTSGFSMLRNNVGYASTAGHCGDSNWYNNNNFIGSTYIREYRNNGSTDAQLISASSVSGYVFTAPTTPVPVYSFSGSQVGDVVCVDGANTGERCGNTVYLTGQCITAQDTGIVTCGLVVTRSSTGQVVQAGDSGGPVYDYRSDGNLNARGLIWGQYQANPELAAYTPINLVDQGLGAAPLCGC